MATTSELIATAKAKLAIVLAADPAAYVDYTIADKSVSKSQYVAHLLAMVETLSKADQTQVDLDFVQFDSGIDLIGTDDTQFTVL